MKSMKALPHSLVLHFDCVVPIPSPQQTASRLLKTNINI
uniref:Uncharacterized protein n=1 Tax=Ascaris lumbricoides TaxID=6252 RepID=A0A0M3HIW2_ASCLU